MSDMDESIRKALAIQEATNAFHENLQLSNIAKIAKMANQNDGMIKAALGQAMQSAGIFELSVGKAMAEAIQKQIAMAATMQQHFALTDTMQRHIAEIAEFEAQFRLPQIKEIQALIQQLDENETTAIVRRMQKEMWVERDSELKRVMESMHQPWLNMKNLAQSFGGFVDLQDIGRALRTLPPFDEGLADQLRSSLGNWQTPLNFVEQSLVDPLTRTEFYLARGLDPALTAFPTNTFLESTTFAGLRPNPHSIANSNESKEGVSTPDSVEASLIRTNAAHHILMRFETRVRGFINERMTATFGPKWVKQRMPSTIRQAWEEKREKARETGEQELTLIAYADFTDYVAIITRNDNWESVFKTVFRRQTLVQESFQRLYPIRICTMHARLITQDDELYLLVETKRLLKAIDLSLCE